MGFYSRVFLLGWTVIPRRYPPIAGVFYMLYSGAYPSGARTMNDFTIGIKTAAQLHAEEEQALQDQLNAGQNALVVSNLLAYFNQRWFLARESKRPIATRMRSNLRQRQGIYDDAKRQAIAAQGGSEIYANITNVKCRAASAWLRDALLGDGKDKPWGITPSPLPELPPDLEQDALYEAQQRLTQAQMMGIPVDPNDAAEMARKAVEATHNEMRELAQREAEMTEAAIEDTLANGGYHDAFADVLDDLVTYPAAILKGPIVRKRLDLAWVRTETGWLAQPKEELVTEYERVSPFDIFPAPWSMDIEDGYLIQRHRLSRSSIAAMLGLPGYDEAAVRAVLKDHDSGGTSNWLGMGIRGEDTTVPVSTDPKTGLATTYKTEMIDALELWDNIPGRFLIDWGIPAEQIPDPDLEYSANVWKVKSWIIKATLNHDPLGQKPYSKTSYERVPSMFWGMGIPDLIKDPQDVANAALRALVNNMGMSSGPQVVVNVERLPEGARITSLHPWKIWQMVSDPLGSTAPAVEFFTVPSNASELMNIFSEASDLADEYSGIPKYLTGESKSGGAARTASGLSMLIGNASKLIKAVTANLDRLIESVIRKTHIHLITQMGNLNLSGDIGIVVRGSESILMKDNMALRRAEFLQLTNNPTDLQITGLEGRANVLKEQAKLLGMNPDEIAKDGDQIRQEQMMQQALMMQQMAAQGQAPGQPAIPNANNTTPGMAPGLAKAGGRPAVSQFDQPSAGG